MTTLQEWARLKPKDVIVLDEDEALALYDDDQPRDDRGRWTNAGGAGASGGTPEPRKRYEHAAAYVSNSQDAMASIGYQTAHAEDLPAPLIADAGVNGDARQPMDAGKLAGIKAGLELVKTTNPTLHDWIRDHVKFVNVDIGDPSGLMATSTMPGEDTYILINANARDDSGEQNFNVEQNLAANSDGTTNHEALSKFALLHEVGHALDYGMMKGRLTKQTAAVLGEKFKYDVKPLADWIRKNVSEYALTGGPGETVGEIAALTFAGKPVPKELQFIADAIHGKHS